MQIFLTKDYINTIGRTEAIQPNLNMDANNLPSTRPHHVPEALQDEVNCQFKELEAACEYY